MAAMDVADDGRQYMQERSLEAAVMALDECRDTLGVPRDFDHFLLAAHKIPRSSQGLRAEDEIRLKEFYEGLETQFGTAHDGELVALLSRDYNTVPGRRRILRIGQIAIAKDYKHSISGPKAIAYRVKQFGKDPQVEGRALLRVCNVADVSKPRKESMQDFEDETHIKKLVENRDEFMELWSLSSTSVVLPRGEYNPANFSYTYAVGVNSILASHTFGENNVGADARADVEYLGIITEALQSARRVSSNTLQTA